MTSNIELYLIILLLISTSASQSSVKKQPQLQSQFVKIEDYSKILSIKSYFSISYLCTQKSLVLIRLQIEGVRRVQIDIIKRFMRCQTTNRKSFKKFKLSLPSHFIYAPDKRNRFKYFPKEALFKVWMVPVDKKWQAFHHSESRDHVTVKFLMPYDRPLMPQNECKSWWSNYVQQPFYSPICAKELETVEMMTYPMALAGDRVGLVHKLEPYNDQYLWKEFQNSFSNASFTFVLWIYIKEYCPNSILCSILHHASWDELKYTPLLFINRKGQLHLEVLIDRKTTKAYLSLSSLKKNKWMLLVFSCHKSEDMRVDVGYYPDFKTQQLISIRLERKAFFKDTQGNIILGGSDLVHSFEGYFGKATFHRRRFIAPSKVQMPSPNHMVFQMGFQERYTNCEVYKKKVIFYNKKLIEKRKTLKKLKKMCMATKTENFLLQPFNAVLQCYIYDDPLFHRKYLFAAEYIKSLIRNKQYFTLDKLSSVLLHRVFELIETKGLSQMSVIISLLKQCNCLGNDLASYILSIIYNYGLSTRMNETKGHSYLLQACYQANRLALISMANKHTLGLDGVPMDYNQAYVYYMTAARTTLSDIRSHSDEDTLTEAVRLTNEKKVEEQQGEDSDMFQWIKQQASMGVTEAQKYMATMLYWGSKGVKRNLTKASTYYKKAAESKSPGSLYNLALIMLKGEGMEKNVDKALEMLHEGAAKNFSKSCLTLGWYYLVHLKDYVQAAHYLEKAFSLGDPDAGHNLAHMLLTGIYPGVKRVERRMAWKFISEAAMRGNIDSALLVSKYNMIGHVSFKRSTKLSITWARYLSEQNPTIGKWLNKGVKAYRLKSWEASMFYYLLAADTGIEVANFNLAFLCEENHGYLSSNMQRECVYRHFNISALRSDQKENSYAWLKLADLYYNQHNISLASSTYASTALKGDPQGLFNLAVLVEEGVKISDDIWKALGVSFDVSRNHYALLYHIYDRCKNSPRKDAYWPCLLALTRVKIIAFCSQYRSWILTSGLAFLVTMLIVVATQLVRSTRSVNDELI